MNTPRISSPPLRSPEQLRGDPAKSVQTKPAAATPVDLITVTIDGTEVQVPKGTLAIRAAEMIGIAIPRFCDHPLLDPVGACRQCMVEVPDMGNGRGMPKPQASCTLECAPGMQIKTQLTSPVAEKAQKGMLEFLLINHPLDCPICDKGGECPLQNQALANGRGESRYEGVKRTFPKPVNISAQILLDRERCVLCARCTRFSEQISGDPFIALVERGALQQVGTYAEDPYNSYFSGNVVQICPVGALTSASYRFQSRPFDLVSTMSTCEHCAGGCQLRVDHRHFQVKRRLAGEAPEVNEEWNCDKGRFAFVSGRGADHLTMPLIREDDKLRVASWPEAIDAAVAGLAAAGGSTGVLTGGRLTLENAYGYAKFARTVLGTNNIDFRSRPIGADEEAFLAANVAGRALGDGVTYAELEKAGHVVLVAFEPEDEAAGIFLRLRKGVRKSGLKVTTVAPYASLGTTKLNATLVATVPGEEVAALRGIDLAPGNIVLVGERAALVPGLLAAAAEVAATAGARLAWVPRRAGDRGAIEAGCLPSLLPGGRPVDDTAARVDVAATWGVDGLPAEDGMDAPQMLAAAAAGELKALVVAGLEPADFADAAAVRAGLEEAGFVVAMENRLSEVTERADVVFPVALIEEHAGTFLNWEHRQGRVNTVIRHPNAPMTDLRVLAALADGLGRPLGVRTPKQALAELTELGPWQPDGAAEAPAEPVAAPAAPAAAAAPEVADGETTVRLATWRQLIDGGRGQDGEEALAATARPSVARISPALASALGVAEGDQVAVGGGAGWYSLPVAVTPGMVDGAVWVPTNSPGTPLGELGVVHGDAVTLSLGGEE
ncbi:MAG: NADH-quinone oxidoreductase subunit G [Propionicimonas sp.]|uniref:NADH-quinone oxidoreductase subunit G n=1 Tax=Propionicimonas sp. TaxID=1955623 RepID=UPI003D0FD088